MSPGPGPSPACVWVFKLTPQPVTSTLAVTPPVTAACPVTAALKGWQGQTPVHTGHKSDQPMLRRARDQIPMPAKKWHCMYGTGVNLAQAEGFTEAFLDRASVNLETAPAGDIFEWGLDGT